MVRMTPKNVFLLTTFLVGIFTLYYVKTLRFVLFDFGDTEEISALDTTRQVIF